MKNYTSKAAFQSVVVVAILQVIGCNGCQQEPNTPRVANSVSENKPSPAVAKKRIAVNWSFKFEKLPRPYALSPDGQYLAVGANSAHALEGASLEIYEVSKGKEVCNVDLPFIRPQSNPSKPSCKLSFRRVGFSPKGDMVAGVLFAVLDILEPNRSERFELRVWHVSTGREIVAFRSVGTRHADSQCAFAFSPDGRHIAWLDDVGAIRVWEMQSGNTVLTLPYSSGSSMTRFAYSPDGRRLAVGDALKVRIFDVTSGEEVRTLPGVGCVAFSPDGKLVAAFDGSFDQVTVWEADTGKKVVSSPLGRTANLIDGEHQLLSFSPDGRHLAANCPLEEGKDTYAGKVWDVSTGKEIFLLQNKDPNGSGCYVSGSPLRFSPDGKRLYGVYRTWTLEE